MHVKKAALKLYFLLMLAVPFTVWGQSNTNAFSPYSMYGLGELQTPGTLPMRSMGGVGVAMRSPAIPNLINPAAFSAVRPKSFLFDFGLEGQCVYNAQQYGDQIRRTSHYGFNFHDIAFQMPLTRGLGLGFSLTPYSSVGYRLKQDVDASDIWGNLGRVQYQWEGEGDVSEVKVGLGWEIFHGFSIGVAAQYYWGNIERHFTTVILQNIVGNGATSNASGTDTYYISRVKGQVGLQWSILYNTSRILTVGAVADLGGALRPRATRVVQAGNLLTSDALSEKERLDLRLPTQVTAGIYYNTPKIAVGADYTYANWGARNTDVERSALGFNVAYRNTHTVKVGFEYTPNRMDARHVLKRWSYRVGGRYGSFNQTYGGVEVQEWAVTAGIGIPIRIMGTSAVDIGVEVGGRGSFAAITEQLSLVRQTYFKFAVGISMFGTDYWFVRPKYD